MNISLDLLIIAILFNSALIFSFRKEIDVYMLFNIGIVFLVAAFPFQNGWLAILGFPMVIVGIWKKELLKRKAFCRKEVRRKNIYLMCGLLFMGIILLLFY